MLSDSDDDDDSIFGDDLGEIEQERLDPQPPGIDHDASTADTRALVSAWHGWRAVLARLAQRQGHYMPASLLDSQYATLEPPQNPTIAVRIDQPVAAIIAALERIV